MNRKWDIVQNEKIYAAVMQVRDYICKLTESLQFK